MTYSSYDGPTLEVNLDALAENYRLLRARFTGSQCAGVVKANAYGLGAAKVVETLTEAGCRIFFVATLEEALALHPHLPQDAELFVFHGVGKNEEKDFLAHGIQPVINNMEQWERWENAAQGASAALHLDTGMCRLGLDLKDIATLSQTPERFAKTGVRLLMSHLACSHDPAHPKNDEQLAALQHYLTALPDLPVSFVNSSGIFMNKSFHYDLARPGCALYGINPTPMAAQNPMRAVATLSAPILQLRHIERDQHVGYGASFRAEAGATIATVALGYADGFQRILSNRAHGYVGGVRVPVIGRVSMDLITLDVSAADKRHLLPGARIEFIGPHQSVDDLAEAAETIGYELFARLGPRVRRTYLN